MVSQSLTPLWPGCCFSSWDRLSVHLLVKWWATAWSSYSQRDLMGYTLILWEQRPGLWGTGGCGYMTLPIPASGWHWTPGFEMVRRITMSFLLGIFQTLREERVQSQERERFLEEILKHTDFKSRRFKWYYCDEMITFIKLHFYQKMGSWIYSQSTLTQSHRHCPTCNSHQLWLPVCNRPEWQPLTWMKMSWDHPNVEQTRK